MYIFHQLREIVSYTHVAKQTNTSIFTAIRTFNRINYPKPSKLPEVLCIDEFRGNVKTGKFQCILVNGAKDRLKTKFFIIDMWEPYKDIAKTFFPNAKIIVDKYHFVRQVSWAIDRIRRRLQKTMRFNASIQR